MKNKIARIWGGKKFEYYRAINPNSGKALVGYYDTKRMTMLFRESEDVVQLKIGQSKGGDDFYEGDVVDCLIFENGELRNVIAAAYYCSNKFCFIFKDKYGNIFTQLEHGLIVEKIVGNIFENYEKIA